MSVLSKLLPPIACAFGTQLGLAAIFVPQANERFYDLGGSIGFLTSAYVSLYYPFLRDKFYLKKSVQLPNILSFAPRQILLMGCVSLWTLRLGSFLLQRALKAGGDSRFDDVRHQPAKFTAFWMIQAVWVSVVGLPIYLVNALPPSAVPALTKRDYFSLGLFASSFLFEIIADREKTAWRKAKENKEHDDKFITSGLWSLSRHPNYVGEVGLWTGVFFLAEKAIRPPFLPTWAIALAAASPLTTYILVRHVSGVPILEKTGDKKFGDDPKWLEYKRNVPIFWPTKFH